MKRLILIGLALLAVACNVEDYKSPWPDGLQWLSVNAVYPAGHADAVQNLIAENARVAQNQEEYTIRYDALVSRFEATKAEYEKTTADISARGIRRRELERFIQSIEKLPEMVTEFDEALWGSLVDHLTINAKDDIVFTLTSGMEIKAI